MRTMRLRNAPAGLVLAAEEAPIPRPGPGELLIQVFAAGVTPTELAWSTTTHTKSGEPRSSAVPGHEFSGRISAIGTGGESLAIGEEVFGMNDWFADGATAEYCTAPISAVAPKPASLSHTEAASVPIGGLTAWQGLYDRLQLQPGETVLVHGGAGAVGVFAVQLARIRGAHVVATASARNLEFVASLGAETVIDYERSDFEAFARSADAVFDTVGGATLARSRAALKPGGRIVTVAAGEEGIDDAFFIVESDRKQLTEIAGLLEAGSLRPVVDTVVPLAQASEAYRGSIERRRRGKVVIAVASQEEAHR
jgi:NADPH:quinone reductase-like Zn-dependent oxidoreductase